MAAKKAVQKTVPLEESKRDRFIRLAEKRTAKALTAIRLIANLANRNNYEFNPGDAKKICGVLARELDDLKRKFDESPTRASKEFKL